MDPEKPVTPRDVQTAESLREQPSATEPVAPIGGTVAKDGTVQPVALPSGGELPTTGGWIGRMFKNLNPLKR